MNGPIGNHGVSPTCVVQPKHHCPWEHHQNCHCSPSKLPLFSYFGNNIGKMPKMPPNKHAYNNNLAQCPQTTPDRLDDPAYEALLTFLKEILLEIRGNITPRSLRRKCSDPFKRNLSTQVDWPQWSCCVAPAIRIWICCILISHI